MIGLLEALLVFAAGAFPWRNENIIRSNVKFDGVRIDDTRLSVRFEDGLSLYAEIFQLVNVDQSGVTAKRVSTLPD